MKYIKTRNELLKQIPNGITIAELGVFVGDFSQIIINVVKPKEFYLVDCFNEEPMFSGDKDGENGITIPNLFIEYQKLVNKYIEHENIHVVRNTTINFLKSISPNTLQAVYIDADHTYNGVYYDLINSYDKINNGWIMGHDYNLCSVRNAVNDFCVQKNLEIEYLTKDKCPSYLIKI